MAKKLDQNFWEKYFKVYDVLNMFIPYQKLLGLIIHEAEIKKGETVLDAGCGTGNLAIKMSKIGAKVIGVDSSIAALDRYRGKDPAAEILIHDITKDLPFPDNYFDKIVCNNVIYTLDPSVRERVVKEFYRVLKPNGLVAATNPLTKFKAISVYNDHIVEDLRRRRPHHVIKDLILLFPEIIKMFYFNLKIQKFNKRGVSKFMGEHEQSKLLQDCGFCPIKSVKAYNDQSSIVVASK